MSEMISKIKKVAVKALCLPLRARGFSEYMAWDWIKRRLSDLRAATNVSLRDKLKAHSRGFLSFRIDQYGITDENYKTIISDRDYMWLHPINAEYKKWLDDKLSFWMILRRFCEYLPEYYYHLRPLPGRVQALPLSDLPQGYTGSEGDVLRLLRERGELALKPVRGTHGDGFYRLSYRDDQYYVNLRCSNESKLSTLLGSLKSDYLISEYIVQHVELSKIYSGAVSTVRIITINRRGQGAQLAEAYLRVGSKSTGVVDNLGAGGMMAAIDIETGRYGDARAVAKGRIYPCACHPDTGALIGGELEHWELIKNTVLEIADYLPQLEYLGFDCAVTQDGFKLIEINTFPDLPRIQLIGEALHNYINERIAYKREHLREFAFSPSDPGGSYEKWLGDRASVRFIFDFLPKKNLPECYYHLLDREGDTLALRMPDCPEGYGASCRELLRLLRERKTLAIRPIKSGRIGADWLSSERGEYYLDGRLNGAQELIGAVLSAGECLITELPAPHDGLSELYGGGVRVRMFSQDGSLSQAKLVTDHASSQLDISSGRVLKNISKHVELENAELPYWQELTGCALEAARALPQLERVCMDFVITNNGVKLLDCCAAPVEEKRDGERKKTHDVFSREKGDKLQ